MNSKKITMVQFGVSSYLFLIAVILFSCTNRTSKNELHRNSDYFKSLNDSSTNDTVFRLYPIFFTFKNVRSSDEIRLISFDNGLKLNSNLNYFEDKDLSESNLRNFNLSDTIFDKTKSAILIYEISGVKKNIVFENLKYSWREVSLNGKSKGVLLKLKSYDIDGETFTCAENLGNANFEIK